jgi:hypothetical protein
VGRSWAARSGGVLVLTVLVMALRRAGYPYVPRPISAVLEAFVEPGAALWWLTLGGPFRTSPADLAGLAVLVLGNTAFWVVLWVIGAATWKLAVRTGRQARG